MQVAADAGGVVPSAQWVLQALDQVTEVVEGLKDLCTLVQHRQVHHWFILVDRQKKVCIVCILLKDVEKFGHCKPLTSVLSEVRDSTNRRPSSFCKKMLLVKMLLSPLYFSELHIKYIFGGKEIKPCLTNDKGTLGGP